MTNPPSVPSLDVEAPLKTHAVRCIEEGRPQDWWLFKAMTPEGKVSNDQPVDVEACVRLLKRLAGALRLLNEGESDILYTDLGVVLTKEEDAWLRALASALPGMGKAMEENERLRADEREATATLKDVNATLERMIRQCADIARTAQPEETL